MDMSDARLGALFSAGSAVNRCEAMKEPNFTNVVTSLVILVGLLISYLPQHWRIYSRGTAEGISPYFVLLGTTSATAGFANILTTGPSRQDIACCKVVDTSECLAGLLGIAQLGVQWICYAGILLLYLVFFRDVSPDAPQTPTPTPPTSDEVEPKTTRNTAVTVSFLCFLHGATILIATILLTTKYPDLLDSWADLLGVMAALLAAVQYLPQIWTTWNLKHVGSLSIPMMCIQTPGGVVFAISLYSRLGMRGWSTWGIFVLSALMQGTLLLMAISFEIARESAAAAATRRAATLKYRRATAPHSVRGRASASHSHAHHAHTHGLGVPQRPGPFRTYSEAYDDALPGPYTAHPQSYAETPDELDRLWYREERQINNETRPLLAPGGIGNPHRNYNSTADVARGSIGGDVNGGEITGSSSGSFGKKSGRNGKGEERKSKK